MIRLADAVGRSMASKGRFWVPPREIREALEAGDLAKCVFESDEYLPGERMWLKIERRLPEGRYLGVLANAPLVLDMRVGDRIEFGAENVIDILKVEN